MGARLCGWVSLVLAISGCETGVIADEDVTLPALDVSQAALTTKRWSVEADRKSLMVGSTLTVPVGTELIYDGTAAYADSVLLIGRLVINGTFTCDDTKDLKLLVKELLIDGAAGRMICGTVQTPRAKKLLVQYLPTVDGGGKISYGSFVVTNGATLSLVGANRTGWARLKRTAATGASTMLLDRNVNWPVGDDIVVSSSSFKGVDLEVLQITENKKVVITNPNTGFAETFSEISFTNKTKESPYTTPPTRPTSLFYKHWGGDGPELHAGKALENRAEVADLTRTIVITGAEKTCPHFMDLATCQKQKNGGTDPTITLDKFTGPDMRFGMGSVGSITIYSAELRAMGKLGQMGKYPLHWHHVGETYVNGVSTSVIKNNVIRDSFQRCVTIHQTNSVWVQNNVCFNQFGHGFFLEDGNEIKNQFIDNVGLGTKKVLKGYHLLVSDVSTSTVSRFPPVATYWLSNPNNKLTGNVAAGSDGSGFWWALKDELHKPMVMNHQTGAMTLMPVAPINTNLGTVQNNVAHSSLIGFTIDGAPNGPCYDEDATREGIQENPRNPGCVSDPNNRFGDYTIVQAPYDPPVVPVFDGMVAYKTGEIGMWNASRRSTVKNSVFADNLMAIALVFTSSLENSAIVAQSKKFVPVVSDINSRDPDNIARSAFNVTTSLFRDKDFAGIKVYDGPFQLKGVSFINFNRAMATNDAATMTRPFAMFPAASNRSTNNRSEGLTFTNDADKPATRSPSVRLDMKHDFGHMSKDNWAAAWVDVDGSLIGSGSKAGYTVMPKDDVPDANDNFIGSTGCSRATGLVNTLVCPSRSGLMFFAFLSQFDLTKKELSTGTLTKWVLPDSSTNVPDLQDDPTQIHQFSFPVAMQATHQFTVGYRENQDIALTRTVTTEWMNYAETSPLMEVFQAGRYCKLTNVDGFSISSGDGPSVQFKSTSRTLMPSGFFSNYTSTGHLLCYVTSSAKLDSLPVIKKGGWYSQNDAAVLSQDLASLEMPLKIGPSGQLLFTASPGPNRGIASVYIAPQPDLANPNVLTGVVPTSLDLYATAYTTKTFTLKTGLPAGSTYRVRIERSGRTTAPDGSKYIVANTLYSP